MKDSRGKSEAASLSQPHAIAVDSPLHLPVGMLVVRVVASHKPTKLIAINLLRVRDCPQA